MGKQHSKMRSFQGWVFLLLIFIWMLLAGFVCTQYFHEKQYKQEALNALLQQYNLRIIEAMASGIPPKAYLNTQPTPVEGLRVSLFNPHGQMLFDNLLDTLPTENHLNRPEIRQALLHGQGYDLRRASATTTSNYFYAATRNAQGQVVRSAAPYVLPLVESLSSYRNIISFMLLMLLVILLTGYLIVKLFWDLQKSMTEKERFKRELTNNINHELKTPVAAIQLCIETLQTRELTTEQQKKIIDRCHENCTRLVNLLTDVSTLTRLEYGRTVISTETISLRRLIWDIIDEMAGPQSLPIQVDIPHPVEVEGNASLLSAVFRNLISNANAYSGGTLIEIKLLNSSDSQVRIGFRDNGRGVSPEHLPHLFERFYCVDKGRCRPMGGTGLGLAIVKNAVEFHQGHVEVRNRKNGGLFFSITLPLRMKPYKSNS